MVLTVPGFYIIPPQYTSVDILHITDQKYILLKCTAIDWNDIGLWPNTYNWESFGSVPGTYLEKVPIFTSPAPTTLEVYTWH